MSNELARTQGNTLEGKMKYAQALATSSLLPRSYQRQPGNLLFALEYADALGVSPIHAITSIHVIEGKPTASADLIAALIRKAGHKLRVTGDDSAARAVLIRSDDPDFEFVAEWDMGKARAAGLAGKGVWKSYPGAMLRSRAITEVARMGAPDALYGVIYTPEELGATVDAEGAPVDLGEAPAPEPEPVRTVTRQRKAAQPEPEQEVRMDLSDDEKGLIRDALGTLDEVAEVIDVQPARDFKAEITMADGDKDLLRALWKAAHDAGESQDVLDAIQAAAAA